MIDTGRALDCDLTMNTHSYTVQCRWTGDLGQGTRSYRGYSRAHTLHIDGKPAIEGSADPAFRGDPARFNPEDLLLASISSCHMLWYLHLCAGAGLVLRDYVDEATAVMREDGRAGGAFVEAVLRPRCFFEAPFDRARAEALHHAAHECCFIANSVNFPIRVEPLLETVAAAGGRGADRCPAG